MMRASVLWALAGAAIGVVAAAVLGATLPQDAPAVHPQPLSVPAWRAASKIAVVTLQGEMDQVTRASVLRRMQRAQDEGAKAIVLEIDTPGGDLLSTLDICLAIKDDTRVPVYAWVRPRAFSAGTILALACRGILVSPNAVFGDAAPIQAIPGFGLSPLPAAERAKIEAPVLAEVVDSARRNGYDEALVRAFVNTPQEVWMLRNKQSSERVFVGRPEYRALFGKDPAVTRGSDTAMAESRAPTDTNYTVLPAYDDHFRPADEPSAADIAAREAHVDFLQSRKPTRAPLTAAEADNWELVAQVDGAQELLVVYAPEAKAFGLAQAVIANDTELRAHFGATQLQRYDEHWGDALVRFLTSWPVRLVLVVVLLAGFLVEIAAPGLGWFGAAATVALVLLLGAPMLAGIQSWWPIVLVLGGVVLVVLEVFVIPGLGVAGFLGAGCILVGLVASFIGAPLNSSEGQSDLTNALAVVVSGGIVSAITAWLVVRALPKSALANAAVLHAMSGDAGPPGAPGATARALVRVGQVGIAITPLRPVGKVDFGGRPVEVQSVGNYVDAGRSVVVVRSSAYAVEVEEREA